MRHPVFHFGIICLAIAFMSGCSKPSPTRAISLDELSVEVKGISREAAFTNKQAGFFYTETNALHRNSWQGWNIMSKEVLEDYEIVAGDQALSRSAVKRAVVFPHQLLREYASGAQETVTLLDSVDGLAVQLRNIGSGPLSVRPLFKDADRSDEFVIKLRDGVLLLAHKRHLSRTPDENYPVWIGVSIGGSTSTIQLQQDGQETPSGFSPAGITTTTSGTSDVLFVAGDTEEETLARSHSIAGNLTDLIAQRRQRMEHLLNYSFFRTDNERFDKAFHWALLSMDALMMNQVKKGIFAGLPWFDNYWGRDSFIALPGATLVSGRFSEAREILRSFAEWQEQNPRSPNYGRVPNLVTVGSIAYNTTDGTPRFVIALGDYFSYCGDTSFVRELYPVVKRSIEGALATRVDEHGFLKHGDAETWMDAAGPAGPWSPRGDRANDIQALWHRQLETGAALARLSKDPQSAQVWTRIAAAVKMNFNKYFVDESDGLIADHLKADGTKDAQFRPNALFALKMIDNELLRGRVLKVITERLVYPHGVASLWQNDPNFHPYHHYEPFYVQDAAYHNGIVWTWLAGPWIDASVAYGSQDLAFVVTENMVHQILDRGAVGTLSELMDAAPRPGEQEPRLSGTFSQAWSLSEFLRVTYQDYLGIHTDAARRILTLSPRLPSAIHESRSSIAFGRSHITLSYSIAATNVETTLEAPDSPDSITVRLDALIGDSSYVVTSTLPPHRTLKLSVSPKEITAHVDGAPAPYATSHRISPRSELNNLELASPSIKPGLKALKGPDHRLLSNAEVKASASSATLLYDVSDPEGDDKGSGAYTYPLTPLLKPGSLDITHFSVSVDDSMAHFMLRFRDLSNPGWHPEYGFQLTYAAIAIDKDGRKGSGSIDVGMNSNFTLDPRYAFETIIYVGGGVRVTDSKGVVLAEYIPVAGDEKNPLGSTKTKEIRFSLPLALLGKPTADWRYTVLVGCQDDHGGAGIGDFRSVEASTKEWTGGGRKKPSDSNVYDVLLPGNR